MNLSDITFEQLVWLVVIVVIFAGAYNTLMTAIKNHLEVKKQKNAPVDALQAQVKEHSRMLANDNRRFEEVEERLGTLKTESAMTLRGVRALLSHEINGNSNDKLQESYDNIDNYLIDKGGK